jgi:3-oxoacyl-[acyl-carrier-protein] synthase III
VSERAAYVTQAAAFLPNEPVGNDDMERVLGRIGGRESRARPIILGRNGITTRHYAIDPATGAPTHTNAQLAAEAVRRLEDGRFSLAQLDCLAASTSIPDQILPSHATMVHGELGGPSCEVIATSAVCICGVSALKYAYMGVLAGLFRHAVASGSEAASSILRAAIFEPELQARVDALQQNPEIAFEKDFLRWMLSDGAGALLIEPEPRAGAASLRIEWIEIFSYANETEACMYAGAEKLRDGRLRSWMWAPPEERVSRSVMALKQDVRLLNEKIMHYTVERGLTDLVARRRIFADQIDHFLPHYSSGFFRDRVHESMKKVSFDVPQERWFTNLPTKGNTGSAALYIMLEELFHSGRLRPGEKVLCYVPESGRFSVAYILLTVV